MMAKLIRFLNKQFPQSSESIKLGIDRDNWLIDVETGRRVAGVYYQKTREEVEAAASCELGIYLHDRNGDKYVYPKA